MEKKPPPQESELKAFQPNVSHETPRAHGIPSWAWCVCGAPSDLATLTQLLLLLLLLCSAKKDSSCFPGSSRSPEPASLSLPSSACFSVPPGGNSRFHAGPCQAVTLRGNKMF